MEEINETFKITNDDTADWALRTIAEDLSERDRLIAIAEKQIEELKFKIDKINEQYDNKTSFLKSCLFEYFGTVKHKQTKTQETYKLLSGSLVLKKPSQKLIKNDDELVKFLRESKYDEFIATKETPKWNEFKARLAIINNHVVDTETGEILSCVGIEDTPATFDIKI